MLNNFIDFDEIPCYMRLLSSFITYFEDDDFIKSRKEIGLICLQFISILLNHFDYHILRISRYILSSCSQTYALYSRFATYYKIVATLKEWLRLFLRSNSVHEDVNTQLTIHQPTSSPECYLSPRLPEM